MKRFALLAVSAALAGAMGTAFAAGTNEKNPDSYATGMSGTGSNAMDPNANGSSVAGSSGTVVVPAQPTVVVPAAPANGAVVTSPAPAGTVVVPAQPAGTVVYPQKDSNINPSYESVGGESAGKSSDSPGQ